MIPLLILGTLAATCYWLYSAAKKRGCSVLWFFAAGVDVFCALGILAEHYFGPQWGWNFSHRGLDSVPFPLVQALIALAIGLHFRTERRPAR